MKKAVLVVALLLAACTPAGPRTSGNACVTDVLHSRGGSDIAFAISGPNMNNVVVDLYAIGETEPYDVWMQIPKRFIDSDDLYIHQLYSEDFKPASYRIHYTLNGTQRTTGYTLGENDSMLIYIHCP